MISFWSLRIRERASFAFAVLALVFGIMAVIWPTLQGSEESSSFGIWLVAGVCALISILVHPTFLSGMKIGIAEFKKATRQVLDDADNDDGPNPA